MVYKARSPKIIESLELLQMKKCLYRIYLQGRTIYELGVISVWISLFSCIHFCFLILV